ncbi:50S ribosomal protein L2 [Coxiella burnetii]|uniref:50S ribosomal protein L2 n=1 Tax=Coxiella burnetii TaxID=777 RepID=UPI00016311AD|nr:50S ribosomal protein L2 [Coxiella burnetii]AIT62743.1 50S ribosomal protein L2 [Coxiella burnetii str. Namibia]ATN85560.1 50S ribosomal protein L2 [Coxiella burnetii str. Schperling]EDQ95168.1 50S ribosomal protein L2 [Coxiella burnetii 'MSU Goat Q177']EDR35026.1 ribosomal protein L2 [Coxiella burnetii Q321]PHH56736.1 50S ribosomal protein L2 [Coxiella burnetii]
MALVKTKPTSPGRRFVVKVVHPELHKGDPYAPLVESKNRINSRNNQGRITLRRRGGGHKRNYRIIDFKRDKEGIEGKVERLEYDPNRSAHIALVLYPDGERRYIIAPKGVHKGSKVVSGREAPIRPGNCLPLQNIPLGATIHNIELKPGKGAQLVRSAGASAQLAAKEGIYAIIRMRSGETRKILAVCRACIGEVSNSEHNLRSLGKAGAKRWRGRRPTVRGVAMNPVDHPHGGGEGKTSGGRHPVSPTGKPTKGYKTRRNKRTSNMIIRDRRKK